MYVLRFYRWMQHEETKCLNKKGDLLTFLNDLPLSEILVLSILKAKSNFTL